MEMGLVDGNSSNRLPPTQPLPYADFELNATILFETILETDNAIELSDFVEVNSKYADQNRKAKSFPICLKKDRMCYLSVVM